MAVGQNWALNIYGGYFANPKISEKLFYQAQPMTRWIQFADLDSSFGQHQGSTLLFDKVYDLQTRGGRLTESNPMPKTAYKIGQGTVTAYEWGNSFDFTEVFERFSEFNIDDPNQRALMNDMAKTRDTMIYNAFLEGKAVYTPVGTDEDPESYWSFTGTAGTTATRNLQVWDLREIVEAMRSGVYASSNASGSTATIRPVPPYNDDGTYMAVGAVATGRILREDPEWQRAAQYGDPDRIFNAELGRTESLRFVEDNFQLARVLGTTSYRGSMVVFGAEAVKQISVLAPEIRKKIPTDFGRDRGVAWYGIEGATAIWQYNSSTEVDNRIVRVESL